MQRISNHSGIGIKGFLEAGVEVRDITYDIDTSGEKPDWVYLTEEDVRALCNHAKYEYRVLFGFV